MCDNMPSDAKHEDRDQIGIVRVQEPGPYSMNQATCTVSPINRLPREILAEIFCNCVPKMMSKTARMSASNAPLLLCRICSSWRQLALATREMWTTMGIVTCDWPTDPSTADNVINTWLERSGTLPLTLRLEHKPSCDPASTMTALIENILSALGSQASRWQDVYISLPETLPVLFPQLGKLPLLQSLHFDGRSQNLANLTFGGSPLLTRLSGSCPLLTHKNPRIPWSQISHLCISTRITIFDASEAIRICQRLEEFHVKLAEHFMIPDNRLTRKPIVENHHLQTLVITSEYGSPFFQSLKLPSLREFGLDVGEPKPAIYLGLKPLLTFLTRSGCELDTLRLKNCILGGAWLLELFEHQSLETVQMLTIENSRNHRMFTDDVLIRLTNPPPIVSRVLLPNLTRLTLEMCVARSASPSTLGRMVYSRRCSWQEHGTKQLKFLSLITPEIDFLHDALLREAISDGLVANNIVVNEEGGRYGDLGADIWDGL
ncbi:hypothetical protein F5887DRAFT_1103970 [Amanita rubescens]|nr:hypothetical protein F5887DRAFT_1103970 [Amanita rubescens]